MRFQDYFHNRIAQLTFTFPEDASTSTGAPFWSAPKRFPRALDFDATDASHASFVQVCVPEALRRSGLLVRMSASAYFVMAPGY